MIINNNCEFYMKQIVIVANNMQIKGMPFWRISWIFALFACEKLLDKCFDIKNQDSLRLSVSEHSCCFSLSLHVAILFPIAMYHRTTLAFIYNVNMPRNIMSRHMRLVMYKVYFLKIILIECCTTKTNIPITQSLCLHCIKNRYNNNQSVLIPIVMLNKTQHLAESFVMRIFQFLQFSI